jgi:hypothetical protein
VQVSIGQKNATHATVELFLFQKACKSNANDESSSRKIKKLISCSMLLLVEYQEGMVVRQQWNVEIPNIFWGVLFLAGILEDSLDGDEKPKDVFPLTVRLQ